MSGKNAAIAIALSVGVTMHAINIYISTTILPTVVEDIDGLKLYSWNTTLFVVASIIGTALAGMTANLTGFGHHSGVSIDYNSLSNTALWLFIVFAVANILAIVTARNVIKRTPKH